MKFTFAHYRETFLPGAHLIIQIHFENTPREAARVNTLAASLPLQSTFWNLHNSDASQYYFELSGKLCSAEASSGNSGNT